MKRCVTLILLMIAFLPLLFAQNDVTKFLGIPVDGTKEDMIQKLKAKGFKYDYNSDWLTGEFNGNDVIVSPVTNNGKVYRIAVVDANKTDEIGIRIRFNHLLKQFSDNKKYMPAFTEDLTIPQSEDISYEISIHKKRYEASFYQMPQEKTYDTIIEDCETYLLQRYSPEQIKEIKNSTEEQQKAFLFEVFGCVLDILSKKSVWFMIGDYYGKYYIIMYYDNIYNQANGDDL